MGQEHSFQALAFPENVPLRTLAVAYPQARRTPLELRVDLGGGGTMFLYPFGAVVFQDAEAAARDAQLETLRRVEPRLSGPGTGEDMLVREDPACPPGMQGGVLVVDRLTPARAGIIALTVAQSAAMEYYERIVEAMFDRTSRLVDRLERRGTTPLRTGPLHRFIGEAVGTRSEVLSVLHLLDKPDAAWDDPAMDAIYEDLRDEFDLGDRYNALELKLRGIQEALELILDVSRDRRLVWLEVTIVVLIVLELALSLLRRA
jgi:required for meiotic nuclear division protein 1